MGKAFLQGLLVAVVGSWAGGLVAAEMRTWTDQNGGHPTRAELVRMNGTQVLLRREDGRQLQVDFEKLSRDDQRYILAQRNPAQNRSETDDASKPQNPFEVDEEVTAAPSSQSPQTKLDTSTYPQGQLSDIDWSGVRCVPRPENGVWKFSAPAAPPAERPAAAKPLRIPSVRDFDFNRAGSVVANPVCQRVLLSYTRENAANNVGTRLVLCFLKEGRAAQAPGPGCMTALALSDSGTLALMRTAEGGKHDRLEVWSLTPKGVVPQSQWFPYDRARGRGYEVHWGSFLGEGQLATLGVNGILAVWEYQPLKPLYYVRADGGGTPALSPDRQYLAFTAGKQVCVLDLKAQAVVASQTLSHMEKGHLAFRPDGRQLACEGESQLSLLDFANGELLSQIAVKGSSGQMVWTDATHLLLGRSALYDLAHNTLLWHYDGAKEVVGCGGQCWYLVDAPFWNQVLFPTRLPHPGLKEVMDKPAGDSKLVQDAVGHSRLTAEGIQEISLTPPEKPPVLGPGLKPAKK